MSKQQTAKRVRLVPLRQAVDLLDGAGLSVSDFHPPVATSKQLAALTRFRVHAPAATPLAVAGKLLAALVKRAKDPRNLCVLWQMNKLVYEYGYSSDEVRLLSYPVAMERIDEQQANQRAGR